MTLAALAAAEPDREGAYRQLVEQLHAPKPDLAVLSRVRAPAQAWVADHPEAAADLSAALVAALKSSATDLKTAQRLVGVSLPRKVPQKDAAPVVDLVLAIAVDAKGDLSSALNVIRDYDVSQSVSTERVLAIIEAGGSRVVPQALSVMEKNEGFRSALFDVAAKRDLLTDEQWVACAMSQAHQRSQVMPS